MALKPIIAEQYFGLARSCMFQLERGEWFRNNKIKVEPILNDNK